MTPHPPPAPARRAPTWRRWLRPVLVAAELGLDYALLALGPLTRCLPRAAARRYLAVVNALYRERGATLASFRHPHRSLLAYQQEADGLAQAFFDPYLGDGWQRGARVLDLGCFVGAKTAGWARQGAALAMGIDLSERGIAVARAQAHAGNLVFECTSAEALATQPEWRGAFDFVVSFTVFEHIETAALPSVLAAAHALLRPGGRMAICYNHYDDRFGSHATNFVHHPWPQRLVAPHLAQEFCDEALQRAHARGEMGYYPAGYSFVGDLHGNGCYMGLNRLTMPEFLAIARASPFGSAVAAHPYSRAALVRWLWRQGRGPRRFHPSVVYVLTR